MMKTKKQYNTSPKIPAKRSLGQNFLINPHILEKIVVAAKIGKTDTVLEVGPGTGNLTKKLAETAGRIIAVEKDTRLIQLLRDTFAHAANVDIVEDDALELSTKDLPGDCSYKIVANIPYYITSNFLRTVFEKWPKPNLIVLTIQKEVAQRIMAKPPHMNLLALSVQYYSEPEIIGYISKNNFRPIPKVDSAIIRLIPKPKTTDLKQAEKLFKLIRAGYSEKRKKLLPTLVKKLGLKKEIILESFEKIGISPDIRAENLLLENWLSLAFLLFN